MGRPATPWSRAGGAWPGPDDPRWGAVWRAETSEGRRVPPLAAKPSNGFGLHAMLGGVWEWVEAEEPVLRGGQALGPALRSLTRRVHYLAGLAIGPFLVVLCLTGLAYAFTPTITGFLPPIVE